MSAGAIQITLPDIHIWIADDGEITVSRINRESPGRMLVSEIMIMANWLMAKFLAKHNVPAIYRSQTSPRERLYKGNNGTLFQNCMQRKHLSRFILNTVPEHHTGLGLNAYVTATSPIRKYYDLATQRQIRAVLGLEAPSTPEEIDNKRKEWEDKTLKKVLDKFSELKPEFKTVSDAPVDRIYTPSDLENFDFLTDLGFPGEYPFTRGVQPTMYRGRYWTMRQ